MGDVLLISGRDKPRPYNNLPTGLDVRLSSGWLKTSDADAALIAAQVVKLDAHDGPIGAKAQALGPFNDHDARLGFAEHVFER